MPQWAGSCWYYLRYLDAKNPSEFVGKDKEDYWMPVDLYVAGRNMRFCTFSTPVSGTRFSLILGL
jgi:leucyl-tRNA synthetase